MNGIIYNLLQRLTDGKKIRKWKRKKYIFIHTVFFSPMFKIWEEGRSVVVG